MNYDFSPTLSLEVEQAQKDGKPIVALESTIITHGMPYPENLKMAQSVENIIREEGAIPATIAIIDGVLKIGLSDDECDQLAQTQDAMKLSRADLGFAISQRKTGGTTVAATMIAAKLAGISVFATGGIGGVHRGAELSFDISADLPEFTHSDVIVVSAGAKAILDIGKTLEVLETKGVPVVCYGSNIMPAFWSRDSDFAAPLRLDNPQEIADFFHVRRQLKLAGGMLIANPIPQKDEIPATIMNDYIDQSLKDAQNANISGKSVTPYLLARIVELSDGKSLSTNIALVKNNARLAAKIAIAL